MHVALFHGWPPESHTGRRHIKGPAKRHRTIEEALDASEESGTQSVLDMVSVGTTPGPQVVVPLGGDELRAFFGTPHPTRAAVEETDDWLEEIGRGEGVAIVLYEGDRPAEILFAGYSFD